MFKNVIAPIQAWLLSRGRCVGCGVSLSRGKKEAHVGGTQKAICSCGRIYVYNPKTKTYRRALLSEV